MATRQAPDFGILYCRAITRRDPYSQKSPLLTPCDHTRTPCPLSYPLEQGTSCSYTEHVFLARGKKSYGIFSVVSVLRDCEENCIGRLLLNRFLRGTLFCWKVKAEW